MLGACYAPETVFRAPCTEWDLGVLRVFLSHHRASGFLRELVNMQIPGPCPQRWWFSGYGSRWRQEPVFKKHPPAPNPKGDNNSEGDEDSGQKRREAQAQEKCSCLLPLRADSWEKNKKCRALGCQLRIVANWKLTMAFTQKSKRTMSQFYEHNKPWLSTLRNFLI